MVLDNETMAKVLCLLDRKSSKHSCLEHASYLLYHPGSAMMYGLDGRWTSPSYT